MIAREEDLPNAIRTALARFEEFRAAYAALPAPADGAAEAADRILQAVA